LPENVLRMCARRTAQRNGVVTTLATRY
jgi:hypothetical protein